VTSGEFRAGPEPFNGFPNSGLATAVPNLFFSRVLPEIEDPEELVVSLYLFFAQGLVRRWPRFVSLSELKADSALLASLARLCPEASPALALARGLELAIRRRVLCAATVFSGGREEVLYAINNPANRRALSRLDRVELPEPLPPAEAAATPNIFVLYEDNIGNITPLIAEELKEAEERYPAEWIREAFREAVEMNKRSWRYIERILRRWEAEGPSYEEPERDPEREWLEQRYARGKRRPATSR
jgi:DnaD/phage-associated family protein